MFSGESMISLVPRVQSKQTEPIIRERDVPIIEQLAGDVARLEAAQVSLVELVADMAVHGAMFQMLLTEKLKELSALRVTNSNLRDELRRYTAARVVA